MPHELTANEKKSLFWSAIFSYCTQQRTISRSGCDVPRKVDYSYDNQRQLAQWLDQEEASKHLPKPNSDPQCSWSLFGGVLVVWFSEFFLNPGKIITSEKYAQQIDEMHRKLQYLQLALVNKKGPILHNARLHIAQPMLQKLNKLGCELLPHPPYSSHLLIAFCRENTFTTSRMQKMLFKNSLNPEAQIFMVEE